MGLSAGRFQPNDIGGADDLIGPRSGLTRVESAGNISEVKIRPMHASDAGAVLRIYQTCLDGGDASFEATAPGWAAFDTTRLPGHRFVAVDDDGTVLGWVAVCAVSDR